MAGDEWELCSFGMSVYGPRIKVNWDVSLRVFATGPGHEEGGVPLL